MKAFLDYIAEFSFTDPCQVKISIDSYEETKIVSVRFFQQGDIFKSIPQHLYYHISKIKIPYSKVEIMFYPISDINISLRRLRFI